MTQFRQLIALFFQHFHTYVSGSWNFVFLWEVWWEGAKRRTSPHPSPSTTPLLQDHPHSDREVFATDISYSSVPFLGNGPWDITQEIFWELKVEVLDFHPSAESKLCPDLLDRKGHAHWRKKDEIFKNRTESWSSQWSEFMLYLTPLCWKDISIISKKQNKPNNWAQNNHLCNRNRKWWAVAETTARK